MFNLKRSMITMPNTFQRRLTFQIGSPTNKNIIIIWMRFLFYISATVDDCSTFF